MNETFTSKKYVLLRNEHKKVAAFIQFSVTMNMNGKGNETAQ